KSRAVRDERATMDRPRNRVRRFVFCRPPCRRLVHALGPPTWLCPVCDLPDHHRCPVDDIALGGFDLIRFVLARGAIKRPTMNPLIRPHTCAVVLTWGVVKSNAVWIPMISRML